MTLREKVPILWTERRFQDEWKMSSQLVERPKPQAME